MNIELETDSDGDVIVERSKLKPLSVTVHCSNTFRKQKHTIEKNYKETENSKTYRIHALIGSSPLDTCRLEQVGLEVWSGAYLMAEFLVGKKGLVKGKNVLELGAGTGLVGLICHDLGARRVVLTDCCQQVLANAKRNIDSNVQHAGDVMRVSKLDWNCGTIPVTLLDADVLIASDPIYDNDLTESFMKTCLQIMIGSSNSDTICLYIALEKRMVFTLHQLKAHYPHYEYWRQLFVCTDERSVEAEGLCYHLGSAVAQTGRKTHQQDRKTATLSDVNLIEIDGYCIAGKQIDLDSIPCCISHYERSPHMEVWQLWCTRACTAL